MILNKANLSLHIKYSYLFKNKLYNLIHLYYHLAINYEKKRLFINLFIKIIIRLN
jgi:hypothetical protein